MDERFLKEEGAEVFTGNELILKGALEPATFQEMKDWVGTAFELSSAANLYITYLVTTHQADGGGTVWVRPNRASRVNTNSPVTLRTADINLDTHVLLPPRTWDREAS